MDAPVRVALVGYGLAGRVFHAPLLTADHLHGISSPDSHHSTSGASDTIFM